MNAKKILDPPMVATCEEPQTSAWTNSNWYLKVGFLIGIMVLVGFTLQHGSQIGRTQSLLNFGNPRTKSLLFIFSNLLFTHMSQSFMPQFFAVKKGGREWLRCSGDSACVCVCARITRHTERERERETTWNKVMYIPNLTRQVTRSWFKYQLS